MKHETNGKRMVKLFAENSSESELLQRLFSMLSERTIKTGVIRLLKQRGENVLIIET